MFLVKDLIGDKYQDVLQMWAGAQSGLIEGDMSLTDRGDSR